MAKVEREAALMKESATKDARQIQLAAKHVKNRTLALVKNPDFQTCTFFTGCGVITVGAVGGAFGTASGIIIGGAAGVVPSLLTFGLSIPAGATLGGAAGVCTGTVIGSSAGGIAGYSIYKYRVEINNGIVYVKVKSMETLECAQVKLSAAVAKSQASLQSTISSIRKKAADAALATQTRAAVATHSVRVKCGEVADVATLKTKEIVTFATTTRAGVTSASALAGGAVGGTTGGAIGTVAGAAVGVIPAVFTLGLSVPIFAAVGMCAGTAAGGLAGTVGGGAVGYSGFTYRKEIKDTAHNAWEKASTSMGYVKSKASEKAMHVKASAKALVSSGTGGTDVSAAR